MQPIIESKKVFQAQEVWRNNPISFSQTFFGSRLWQKQVEIFEAVRDHERVAVASGNDIGKSKIASEIVLWYLITHYPSKVIITAPTFNQVQDILWKEITKLYNQAKIPIGGELLQTELKLNEEWFAIGVSTNEVNRFQGYHSPHLLAILDEALGIAPSIWEALEGLHPHRVLAIGNPLEPVGNFFSRFQSPLWHKINVSCEEAVAWQEVNGEIPGLVTRKWIDERRQEWGIRSPLYQARVLGKFPQEGTDTLIHLDWMDKCRNQELEEVEDALKIVAADVARYGEDKTVIIDRVEHTFTGIEIKEKIPTTMTSGIVKRHYEKQDADSLVVDDDGVGGGVTDMLSEQRIGVLAFKGGSREKAIDHNHFKNLRSQFYWILAKKLEKSLYSFKGIPQREFETLKNQLCSIKYYIDSEGKIVVESKDDMKARGLPSPDYGDCCMMSEYAFYMGRVGDIKAYRYR